MEMHQLEYFVETARRGSFTKAAEKCLVSQPSLSQAIAKLEKELGAPLFERLGRRIRLTDAGQLLLERAVQILALADDARLRIADDGQDGRITVGAIPTVGPYLLPRILSEFSTRYPHARIDVREEPTERLVASCLAGEVDVFLAALPLPEKRLAVERLFTEELYLLVQRSHRLAEKSRVSLKDLQDECFILLTDAHCLTDQIETFCHERDLRPVNTERASQLMMIQELVSLGHGISFVPEMAQKSDFHPNRVYRSLHGVRPKRTLVAATLRDRYQSRLTRRFLDLLREHRTGRDAEPGKGSNE